MIVIVIAHTIEHDFNVAFEGPDRLRCAGIHTTACDKEVMYIAR